MDGLRDKQRGMIIGLAVGDALGAAVEFKARGTFQPVTGYRTGTHGLTPGEWTDDTQMALALAWSLKDGFDIQCQAENYQKWWANDPRFNIRPPFDRGGQTGSALSAYGRDGAIRIAGSSGSSGNGSIMRISPVVAWYLGQWSDPEAQPDHRALTLFASHYCALSSIVTHPSQTCQRCCGLLGVILTAAALGDSFDSAAVGIRFEHIPADCPVRDMWERGRWRALSSDGISSSGYSVDTLDAALWAVHGASSFEDAVLRAVNLGNDADSVGAVAGQMAGALYGESGIPAHLLEGLKGQDLLEAAMEGLF